MVWSIVNLGEAVTERSGVVFVRDVVSLCMTLITNIVTVMKCVAGATQTTEQRTRRNEGKHRERGTEGHQVSIVALLSGDR